MILVTLLDRILQPDPPEKWKTVQAALESTAKTLRLCLVMFVGIVVPLALLLIVAIIMSGRAGLQHETCATAPPTLAQAD